MKTETRQNLLIRLKISGVILLLLAYIPYFVCPSDSKMYSFFNEMYGVFSAIGISFVLFSLYKRYIVPIACLFLVIGSLFSLDYIWTDMWKTHYPALIIIISTILCSLLSFIFYLRHNFSHK